MKCLSKAILQSGDADSLEELVNAEQERNLRARVKRANAREVRAEIHRLAKKDALIANTIAPGVPVSAYLIKVVGAEPCQVMSLG